VDRVGAVLVETYRITRLIAEGGMGDVYEAEHLRVPKRFAVKFLKGALVEKAEALARFRREAEIIATLDHPNVVTLQDYNVGDDGVPYIVLEFLDGEHLGKRIARAKLTLAEAVPIVQAVARALAAAHARNVVHRDLKPENVIVCKNDTIKVVDFGVAKLRGADGLTAFNTTVGTVPYMAPEQILGGALDGRTDEFALAAITHEMLTGITCFGGGGAVPDQALRVLRHVPPPIEGVPPAANDVLARALAKEAADRFPSVTEFADALAAAAQGADEPAPLPGEATTISPITNEPRLDLRTPTGVVDRAILVPVQRPASSTARSMRAVEPTGRHWRSALLRPRVLSIAAGATLGVIVAAVIWLFAK
jgi:serine/threonine-protein kinase